MWTNWNKAKYFVPKTVGHSVDYLVCLEDGDMIVAAWMNIGGWDREPNSPITHWADLPKPPNK